MVEELASLSWFYEDFNGKAWGPFRNGQMRSWYESGKFRAGRDLLVRPEMWTAVRPLKDLFPESSGTEPFTRLPEASRAQLQGMGHGAHGLAGYGAPGPPVYGLMGHSPAPPAAAYRHSCWMRIALRHSINPPLS